MWRCDKCGRASANANPSHACGRYDLESHFGPPTVREIDEAFLALLREFGPVIAVPEKTRIAFQARISFAQLTVRKQWVLGHFVLARRADDPAFTRVETISPRNHVHRFRLDRPAEIEPLRNYALEAYAVRPAEASRLRPAPRRSAFGCWRGRKGR